MREYNSSLIELAFVHTHVRTYWHVAYSVFCVILFSGCIKMNDDSSNTVSRFSMVENVFKFYFTSDNGIRICYGNFVNIYSKVN